MRWTPKAKVALVEAIRLGRLTRDQAMAQHGISQEEMAFLERDYDAGAARGVPESRMKRPITWRPSVANKPAARRQESAQREHAAAVLR